MSGAQPKLGVVIATDSAEVVRPLTAALRAQTEAAALEVVVAAPGSLHAQITEQLDGPFLSVRAIDRDPSAVGLTEARVAAALSSTSPLVVFTETHCFPEPGWAAALIEAHADGADVVGPVFVNGNPEFSISWAGFLAHYGGFADPIPPPPWPDLPGNNSAYARPILEDLGDSLVPMLESEYMLHGRLIEQGRDLRLVPGARVRHFNVSRFGPSLIEAFRAGRVFGALRRQAWPLPKSLGYALAWPLIAVIRTVRHRRDGRRISVSVGFSLTVALVVELAAHSLGEAAGYLFGPQRNPRPLDRMELRRDLFCRGTGESESWWFGEIGR